MRCNPSRRRALWILLGAPAVGFLILPRTGRTAETSRFLLQEHGGVRVIRGVSEEANFEAVTLPPEKEEEEPTAVPPPAPAVPATTKRRGIVTHRAGGPGQVRARLHGQRPKSQIRVHRIGSGRM